MAQLTDGQLTTEANVIKNETAEGANTANRVGTMLNDLIDSKLNNDDATTANITSTTDKRYVTDAELVVIGNTSGTNSGNETTTTIGALVNGATEKNTPVDTDMVGLMDSAAANIWKKLSWLNIKATLKAYFDTIYEAIGSGNAIESLSYDQATGTITSNLEGGGSALTPIPPQISTDLNNSVSSGSDGGVYYQEWSSVIDLDNTGTYSCVPNDPIVVGFFNGVAIDVLNNQISSISIVVNGVVQMYKIDWDFVGANVEWLVSHTNVNIQVQWLNKL